MRARNLFAVVLAAGESSRFGSTKQLAPYAGGTLVAHAMRAAESVCGRRTLLVVGNEWRNVVTACAPLAGFFARNPRYRDGLSTSIRSGIESVSGAAEAVLLMLADQALIREEDLRALIARWEEAPDSIVASAYSGTLGPPVIFPSEYFTELCTLSGDSGAKRLIDKYADLLIAVKNDAASTDIDRPEDLEALR